jgi:hypothetical protein
MNTITLPNQVIALPHTPREINHTSRRRIGYHVYLSYYFHLFSILSTADQKEIMYNNSIWYCNGYATDSSDDSILTPRIPVYYEITRAAAMNWQSYSIEMKAAWSRRAASLNERPPNDGKFESIPAQLVDDENPRSINSNIIIQSLSTDWVNLSRLFRNALLPSTRITKRSKQYRFGNEIVTLSFQKYRVFYLNYILKLSIFGYPLFSNLHPYEIVHRKKRECIVHIYSHERASNLMTFGGVNACSIVKNGKRFLMCAKVNLKNRAGKNRIGYVIEEDGNVLNILLDGLCLDDAFVCMQRPLYNPVLGKFVFTDQHSVRHEGETYQLSHIWPIRIKMNVHTGNSSFIFSTCTIDNE